MKKALKTKYIVLVICMAIAYSILGNMSFKILSKQLLWISNETNGLIQGTLVINIIGVILFSIVIFKLLKLALIDFLIDKQSLINGIKAIGLLWAITQVIILGLTLFNSQPINWHTFSSREFGNLFAQLFGNAPYEEFVFRGFLLIQIFIILNVKGKRFKSLIISIIISQIIFTIVHIPNRLLIDMEENLFLDSIQLFLGGVIGALIFIRTKNLIYLIGFHAFTNVPFNIFQSSASPELITLILGLLIAILWNKIFHKQILSPFGESIYS